MLQCGTYIFIVKEYYLCHGLTILILSRLRWANANAVLTDPFMFLFKKSHFTLNCFPWFRLGHSLT